MAFHVNSSGAPEIHHDHAAETGSPSLLAKVSRQAVSLSRRFMVAYAAFNLKHLEHTMRAFSARNGEAHDTRSFYAGIFAHARQRLQVKQYSVEQDLLRILTLLEARGPGTPHGAHATATPPAFTDVLEALAGQRQRDAEAAASAAERHDHRGQS
ncbi:hypothetical protein HBDW_24610 [Herbaspirillum sp. DW155]|uniref:hypothetical protein n=1 Tax=Herbaspirillum sp. DW155 TaxID=3095609 RepID=UPI00308DFAA4|nr:hypothetical protein HBDW_24610 [Herbaspirillum sp. DW155]